MVARFFRKMEIVEEMINRVKIFTILSHSIRSIFHAHNLELGFHTPFLCRLRVLHP